MIVEQGYLPLPLEELAKRIGISKALIYRYYPTQIDLFDALSSHLLSDLKTDDLARLSRAPEVDLAVIACAERYFDHVCRYGPALYILSSDLYCAGKLDPKRLRGLERLMAKLARRLKTRFAMSGRDSLASLRMFAAMAEEGGAMAFHDPHKVLVTRQTLSTLISGALDRFSNI